MPGVRFYQLNERGNNMGIVSLNNIEVNFEACVEMMDDEIREKVHSSIDFSLGEPTEQEFLDAYRKEHFEKYGEQFCI